MNFLAMIPFKDWAYLAAVLAFSAFVGWGIHHERAIGFTHGATSVQTKWDAAVAADQSAKTREIQRVAVAQKETDHEAEKFQALADVGAVHVAASVDSVQQRFTALRPRDMSCAAPVAASGASAAAADGRDVRADMFRVVVQAARRLGQLRDDARGRGLNAEGHYDALTPNPPKETP